MDRAAFITPTFITNEMELDFFDAAVQGLYNQTDPAWVQVVVNDASPFSGVSDYLLTLQETSDGKIKLIDNPVNIGPGASRNIAAHWAKNNDIELLLYNDADDISHPNRLEVIKHAFVQKADVGLVYGGFKVIDEKDHLVSAANINPGILEILECIDNHPVEGEDCWIDIGTKTGFTCLPSSTAVRTEVALKTPFPNYYVCEDAYTWMVMSAAGTKFKHVTGIDSLYRIPSFCEGSASRQRSGDDNFAVRKAEVETEGFLNAISLAQNRGVLSASAAQELVEKFFDKLHETMTKFGYPKAVENLKQGAKLGKI